VSADVKCEMNNLFRKLLYAKGQKDFAEAENQIKDTCEPFHQYPAVCIAIFELVHGWPCTPLPFTIHTAGRVYNTSLSVEMLYIVDRLVVTALAAGHW